MANFRVLKVGLLALSFCLLAHGADADSKRMTLKEKIQEVATKILKGETSSLFKRRAERQSGEARLACTDSRDCPFDSHQICQYGVCQCPHPTEMYYWYSRSRCEIDPGRPCDPNLPVPCHGKFAECLPDVQSRTGYSCTCTDGLESNGWTCTNGFMRNCTSSWSDDENGCNYGAGLACFEEKCRCELEPDQKYDPIRKQCAAQEEYPCLMLEIGWLNCQTGLTCVRPQGSTEFPLLGVCRAVVRD